MPWAENVKHLSCDTVTDLRIIGEVDSARRAMAGLVAIPAPASRVWVSTGTLLAPSEPLLARPAGMRSKSQDIAPSMECFEPLSASRRRVHQVLVGSCIADRRPEPLSASTSSVNSTPSVSSVRQTTRHDRRSPKGVRNLNSSGIV